MFKKIKLVGGTALTSREVNLEQILRPDLARAKFLEIKKEDMKDGVETLRNGKERTVFDLPEVIVSNMAAKQFYGMSIFLAFHPKAPWSSTIHECKVGENIFKDYDPKAVGDLEYIVRIYELNSNTL